MKARKKSVYDVRQVLHTLDGRHGADQFVYLGLFPVNNVFIQNVWTNGQVFTLVC